MVFVVWWVEVDYFIVVKFDDVLIVCIELVKFGGVLLIV